MYRVQWNKRVGWSNIGWTTVGEFKDRETAFAEAKVIGLTYRHVRVLGDTVTKLKKTHYTVKDGKIYQGSGRGR